MATIVVTDLGNVSVDGVPSGSVTDVLANFKAVVGIRGDLLRAVQNWNAAREKAHADALAARDAAHADALAKRDAAHIDALAAKDAQIAELQARVSELETLVGGTEEAKRLAREKRRQELLATKDAADAGLAVLEEPTP